MQAFLEYAFQVSIRNPRVSDPARASICTLVLALLGLLVQKYTNTDNHLSPERRVAVTTASRPSSAPNHFSYLRVLFSVPTRSYAGGKTRARRCVAGNESELRLWYLNI